MVSFNCEGCNDVIKKPKLDQHFYKCHAPVTCLDCNTQFGQPSEWKTHTTCISEAEKYEKSVYRGEKKGKDKKSKNAMPGTSVVKVRPLAAESVKEVEMKPAEDMKKKTEKKTAEESAEGKEKRAKKDTKRKADGGGTADVKSIELSNGEHKKAKKDDVAANNGQKASPMRSSALMQSSQAIAAPGAPQKKKKGDKYKAEKEKRLAKRQAAAMGQTGVSSSANAIPVSSKKWPKDTDTSMTNAAPVGDASQEVTLKTTQDVAKNRMHMSKKETKLAEKAARKKAKKMKKLEKKKKEETVDKSGMSASDKEIIMQELSKESTEPGIAKTDMVDQPVLQVVLPREKEAESIRENGKVSKDDHDKKVSMEKSKGEEAKEKKVKKEKKSKKAEEIMGEPTLDMLKEKSHISKPKDEKKSKAKEEFGEEKSAEVPAEGVASKEERKKKKKSKSESKKGEEVKA